jgi:dihydroflavonol-4-reductase
MPLTVVTGASGHVGANLVRALLAHGRNVRALALEPGTPTSLQGLDVEIRNGDIRDAAFVSESLRGADVVFHLAARISILMSDWHLVESINVGGPRNVVAACLEHGVRRLVHFSSIHAHQQEPLDAPMDESRAYVHHKGMPPYDRSKAAGERVILAGIQQGLDTVILNPTGILGPHDYQPSHFGVGLINLAAGKIPGQVGGGFDFVDVRDVVSAALEAEANAPSGSKYILSGTWIDMPSITASIENITGVPAPRILCPTWLARFGAPFATAFASWTGTRPVFTTASLMALRSNRDMSSLRAQRDLGYAPRSFHVSLEDTLRWFVAQGMLAAPPNFRNPGEAPGVQQSVNP